VWSGTYDGLWVYLTAPFAGSIIGWAVFRLLYPADEGDVGDLEDELEEDYLEDALEPE
jgi:hypothetical protein